MQYFMQNYCIGITGLRTRALTFILPTMQHLVVHPKTAVAFFSYLHPNEHFNTGLKCVLPNPLSLPLFYGQFVLT